MSIKVNKYNITMFLMQCYIFVASLIGYSDFQQFFLIFFCVAAFATTFSCRKLKVERIGLSYLCFVVWSACQIVFGICINKTMASSYLITVTLNLIFIIAMTSFVSCTRIEFTIQKIIHAYIVTLLFLLVVSARTLSTKRLGLANENGVSFRIGFIESSISPNGVALWCSVAFLLSLYMWQRTKRRQYVGCLILFLIGVILAGSRKGFLTTIVATMIFYIYSGGGKRVVKRAFVTLMAIVIALIMIFEIPALYNAIGFRVEELFYMFILKTNDVNIVGGSLRTRAYLINQAKGFIEQRPFVGWGLNAFAVMGNLHIVADNNYYELLVSSGIIGFFLYYFWVVIFLVKLINTKIKDSTYFLIVSLLVVGLISDLTGSTYYKREDFIPFILAVAFYTIYKEEKGDIYYG